MSPRETEIILWLSHGKTTDRSARFSASNQQPSRDTSAKPWTSLALRM